MTSYDFKKIVKISFLERMWSLVRDIFSVSLYLEKEIGAEPSVLPILSIMALLLLQGLCIFYTASK